MVEFDPVNEISFVEREKGKVKTVHIYLRSDDSQEERHSKWAETFKIDGVGNLLLFVITPNDYEGDSLLIRALIEHLKIEGEDGMVSGMIPVENGRVTLNGKVWLLGKIPSLKKGLGRD